MPGKHSIKFPASANAEDCFYSPAIAPAHAVTGEKVFASNPDPENLLLATFTSGNQSFADDQIIETTADGIEDGRLQFILNAAGPDSAQITSNDLVVAGDAYGSDLSGYVCPCAIPRTKALAAIVHFSSSPDANSSEIGWHYKFATASNLTPTYHYAHVQPRTNGNLYPDNALTCVIGSQTSSTEMELAIILGGFDTNGDPWDGVADFNSYLFGAQFCKWNGSSWDVMFATPWQNENLSPYFDFRSFNDATVTNLAVPDACYRELFNPTARSTSVSNNDEFTHGTGDLIQFNVSTAPTTAMKFWVRRTDANNGWYVNYTSAGVLTLRKVDGGSDTLQGTGTAAVSTADVLSIRLNGNEITVFSDSDWNTRRRQIQVTDAFNNTATTARVELDSAVVDYYVTYPASHTVVPDTDNLPSATAKNPSSASTDISVWAADSMINGDTLGRQSVVPMYQQLMGGNETVYDDSLGGAIISQIVTRMTTISRPRMVVGNNDLHLLIGTNNLYTSGESAAVVTAALESLIDDELAYDPEGDGSKIWNNIFWYPIADRQQSGGAISAAEHTTRRTTINANIAATYASESRVHIVDWLTDRTVTDSNGVETTLRGFADSTNTEYGNGDDVHPNYIGNGMIAEHAYRVKKAL